MSAQLQIIPVRQDVIEEWQNIVWVIKKVGSEILNSQKKYRHQLRTLNAEIQNTIAEKEREYI